MFQLSCSTNDLESVTATGACGSRLPVWGGVWGDVVYVPSDEAGDCHVLLTFATGFTYAGAVTFVTQAGCVCGGAKGTCPSITVPTNGPLQVDNPSSTCVAFDAGPGD
ncbi:MAG TPA: hypothetical protein VIY73_09300 [Polyangiaceae bacterium]